jgi:murein L,D-transpeptidase YcbB/YkuD
MSRWPCSGSGSTCPRQNEKLYDEVVQQAVMAFQYEHGATPMSCRPGTRRPSTRPSRGSSPLSVTTVLLNMERWRWLPADLGHSM